MMFYSFGVYENKYKHICLPDKPDKKLFKKSKDIIDLMFLMTRIIFAQLVINL